jgi:hypothetical protein
MTRIYVFSLKFTNRWCKVKYFRKKSSCLKNKSINRLKNLKYINIHIKIDRNRMLEIVIHYSYVWKLSRSLGLTESTHRKANERRSCSYVCLLCESHSERNGKTVQQAKLRTMVISSSQCMPTVYYARTGHQEQPNSNYINALAVTV